MRRDKSFKFTLRTAKRNKAECSVNSHKKEKQKWKLNLKPTAKKFHKYKKKLPPN